MYLIRHLPAWHHNALKRPVKTPKLHFPVAGLPAAVRHLTQFKLTWERALLGVGVPNGNELATLPGAIPHFPATVRYVSPQ